jgi:PAS domain S-box-containing protein
MENTFTNSVDFLAGSGGMVTEMRSKNWSASPLGPPDQWPQTLRIALRIMLDSRYSMWLGWGPDLLFFYNDAYARDTLGKKHPWALGRPVREVWAEVWTDLSPRIDRVHETGLATWDVALLLFLERSGYPEETYHTFSYSPLYDEGKVAGILCVVTEETDRVVAERRVTLLKDLAAALTNLKTQKEVFEAVNGCLLADSKDLPFTLTYLLDAATETPNMVACTGMDSAHTVALNSARAPWPLEELLETNAAVVVDQLPQALQSLPKGDWPQAPSRALLIPIAQQGQARPAGFFVAGLNPLRPLDESYRGFINLFAGQIASALSNAHAYEEERRRTEALRELDRAKTTFFSNVSHEFRTPLTLMLGPLEETIAQEQEKLPERAVKELTVVHRNALRLLKLVNSLLDFSRIEAGRVQAAFEPTDLAAFTAELASVFRSAVEKAGMELIVDCPPLGQQVYVDRGMWEKVVLNLLSNAFKFTLQGRIAVALAVRGPNVELSVRDTGSGIPAAELPRLFERFHRVEGTRGRTHEGTGIGLALVQELVKLHGGQIRVESRLDEGSTFTVAIPLGSAHLPPERIQPAASTGGNPLEINSFVEEANRWLPDAADFQTTAYDSEPEASPFRTNGLRPHVLLADDNADMRNYVRRLLQGKYDVDTVTDGREALQAIARRRPDLVLSDVMMPNLDGFGLLKELRAGGQTGDIPVILLSARAGEEATLEGLQAGADDYLVKPFSARELLGRIAALLERKRFLHALAAADDRLGIALRAARMIAWEWDPQDDTVVTSDTAAEVFGLMPGTTLQNSKQGFNLVHPDDLEASRQCLQDAIRKLSTFHNQYRIIRPIDGKVAWMEERGIARKDEVTGRVRVSGVAMDITEAKKGEQEKEQLLERERQARTEAERAGRLKEDFLTTLSHELRTPLNAILGWTQILERGQHDAETVAEGLGVIARNARAQTQLIEDLLDMSRITSGKLRLEVQRVDLPEVIGAAIESIRPAAAAKEIRLVKILDPVRTLVSGDPHRLQQVVWNLLSNAIKFTAKGGKVQVVLQRINSHVQVSVSDDGLGISPAFLPHVFERFRQADASTRRSFGGLGLGLAIVKQLVELHGGTVHASSPGEGRGATFSFTLPLAVASSGESAPHGNTSDAEELFARISLEGITVLVVDDEPDARNLVKRILDGCKAKVILAGSVAEAMKHVKGQQPDVIVSDIGMPEQDGYEFIRRVRGLPREEGRDTPAAALTAYARPQDRRQALLAGYQSHVVKPADPAELVTVVASLAGKFSMARPKGSG